MRNFLIIFIGFAFAALASGCGSKNDATAGANPNAAKPAAPAGPPPGLPVKAVPVKTGEVIDEVTAVGSLIAEESVMIRPEIDGRVVALNIQEGQAVAAGARLVTIDSAEVEAQLAQVRADLNTEMLRLERARELFEQKFISRDALEVQQGNAARLEARLAEVKTRVEKTVIRAPFAGVLGLRQISPGAYIKAGDDIVRLENLNSIKVDFKIPENYLAKVRPNQDIAIRLDAFPTESFTGKVYATEPKIDEKTRTISMRARIANKGLKLKPGMFVRVAVTLENRPNALMVPETAIWPQGKDSFVFKVVDGKAVLTRIDIGVRRPGEVEVLSGLASGDTVITEGQMKLRDGAPVTVLAPPPAPAAPAPGAAPAKS
ncbi:MAG: efflux RND transporter periplasmic adaptor subunit [Burkholderiales bacterium]